MPAAGLAGPHPEYAGSDRTDGGLSQRDERLLVAAQRADRHVVAVGLGEGHVRDAFRQRRRFRQDRDSGSERLGCEAEPGDAVDDGRDVERERVRLEWHCRGRRGVAAIDDRRVAGRLSRRVDHVVHRGDRDRVATALHEDLDRAGAFRHLDPDRGPAGDHEAGLPSHRLDEVGTLRRHELGECGPIRRVPELAYLDLPGNPGWGDQRQLKCAGGPWHAAAAQAGLADRSVARDLEGAHELGIVTGRAPRPG